MEKDLFSFLLANEDLAHLHNRVAKAVLLKGRWVDRNDMCDVGQPVARVQHLEPKQEKKKMRRKLKSQPACRFIGSFCP